MTSSRPQTDGTSDIGAALAAVRRRIDAAAGQVAGQVTEQTTGRDRETAAPAVTLVAVSKKQPVAKIEAALAAGQRVFGENRVQEAAAKWPALKAAWPGVSLHLIGPLQTNKVRQALALFDVVESLDRPKLAAALAREKARIGRCPDCFIQVNTGAEPQKAGILPEAADAFIRLCRDELGLPVIGLMCIPPVDEEPSLHFALLAEIAKRNGLAQLSMGMSGDFEIAVAFGATLVRVGTAVFGPRLSVAPGAPGAPAAPVAGSGGQG